VINHSEDAALWAFKMSVLFAYPILQFKPDVIHTHFAYGNARFALFISRLLGIPFTFTIHGWYDLYKAPPSFLKEVVLNSKKTVTVCEFNKKYLLSTYDIPEEKVDVLRCGIPVERFSAGGIQKINRLIISVGRLHYHKAQHVLVEACKLLDKKNETFECWIIGNGDLRDTIQHQISELGLDAKVLLLGEKSNEEVQALMPKAQIFVLTSEVEVVGLVNAEAMASGLPVIATSVFGVPELVEHEITGLLCPPNNPEAVAAHLELLLKDPGRCAEMGAKGRKKVIQMHNLSVQVQRLISIWK
jgi:colanic acid/amylovoran biosynthesis glycosyltransferase